MPDNGFLLTIEGIDGAGKSTQARRLVENLRARGRAAVLLREPTDGPIGQRIRMLAREGRLDPQTEFELFLDDRQQDVRENIAPAIARGEVVVLDRYYPSSMAYQGARGLDPEMIREANEAIAPRPDLLLLLELPVAKAIERIHSREQDSAPDLFEEADYLEKVRTILHRIDWPQKVVLDATLPEEELAAQILDVVLERCDATERSVR